MSDDIAIVGFSFKGPQEAESTAGLWEVLRNGRNVMTEWPETRVNLDPYYTADPTVINKLHSKGAHFLKEDHALFDAPFFSINAKEAASMDPQHRLTLETSYHAFENAGMSLEALRGTSTGVFAASTSDDYHRMIIKDPESCRPAMTGCALSLLANRVSWYFDLLGPSVHVDTACSSSLTALDMACQSMRSGDMSTALVVGANLILGPENSVMLSNGGFLSPDGVCYSFDHRANGYSRGEGMVGIVIKRVSDAIRDGDVIRAVIRSTGSNQDGRTPTLTQPSTDSQEQLIRHVYGKAGLGLESTRFFEAHGTGTAVGDPIEMKAIGRVFRKCRSAGEPLYVGSIKSNVGHLEASSGLAGVVKAVLALEKGIIPPNALFEKMNPDIDAEFYNLAVPSKCVPWPTDGLRRASVNSFGFGGSNTHVVLDDAFHFLNTRGLAGNHHTTTSSGTVSNIAKKEAGVYSGHLQNGDGASLVHEPPINAFANGHTNGHTNGFTNGFINDAEKKLAITKETTAHNGHGNAPCPPDTISPRLVVLSAADETSLKSLIQAYETYQHDGCSSSSPSLPPSQSELDRLAYTLAARRSVMLWRTFSVVIPRGPTTTGPDEMKPSPTPKRWWPGMGKPTRAAAADTISIAFLFTGQGAQYVGMGLQLIKYPVFAETLRKVDESLKSEGCVWSVFDELSKGGDSDNNIDQPQYSQPLCTGLQIALVELLKSFGVTPSAVIGHSSGEIAAAYASGALSLSSACRIAYHRGQLAGKMKSTMMIKRPNAMLSVNLPASQVPDYLGSITGATPEQQLREQVHVACINSPFNTTLSGPEDLLDIIKQQLDSEGVFAQKVKTGVPYHSPLMQTIRSEYMELIGSLEPGEGDFSAVPMVSSVSGQAVPSQATLLSPSYWSDNLVSPVRFSDALTTALAEGHPKMMGANPISHIIEIGPHPALRRPAQDTLGQMMQNKKRPVRYAHTLHRSKPAHQAILELVGQLFCDGYPVSMSRINQEDDDDDGWGDGKTTKPTLNFCVDCPEYPFNHSRSYWNEPRLSRDSRLRASAPVDSLGSRDHDWNPLEPRWRRFLNAESTPWTKDHMVMNSLLYPGTGMVIMALEAVKQISPENRALSGFFIKEAHFLNPIVVGETHEDSTEVVVHLRRIQSLYEKGSTWSEVKIMTQSKDRWTECFQGLIQAQYREETPSQVDGGLERRLWHDDMTSKLEQATKSCSKLLDRQTFYKIHDRAGIVYGKAFRLLDDIHWDGANVAIARVDVTAHETPSLAHPAILDCALQLLLAQTTRGFSDSLPTFVPSHLYNTWVAASGWQSPDTSSVRFLTENTASPDAQGIEAAIHIFSENGSPLCAMEKTVLSPISNTQENDTSDNNNNLLYEIEWKPQLSLMDREMLRRACGSEIPAATADNQSAMEEFRRVLDPALEQVLQTSLQRLSTVEPTSLPESMQRHLQWMKHHVAAAAATLDAPQEGQDDGQNEKTGHRLDTLASLEHIEELYPSWSIFPTFARDLESILVGKVDPLQLAFDTGLAERFYADIFNTLCGGDNFYRLLELLSHQNPTMRILEVGAGTGGMTAHILSTLGDLERRGGGTKFAEYVYTDISPSFFESARDKFQDFSSRMTFRTFDLDVGAVDQGLEEGSFDLVVAGCVLHATKSLKSTLGTLRAMLKPGGRLLSLEPIAPANVTTNFAFGLLPGWWSSTDDYRRMSPTLAEPQWDQALRDHGFSGNDVVLRDYGIDSCHTFSIMLSTRAEPSALNGVAAPAGRLVLLVREEEDLGPKAAAEAVADFIQARSSHFWTTPPILLPLHQAKEFDFAMCDLVVSLLEVDAPPFLARMSESEFLDLKTMIQKVRQLLWVGQVDWRDPGHHPPEYDIMQGFLRSIRSENIDKHIVTLSVEKPGGQRYQYDPSHLAEHIGKVVASTFESQSNEEVEYRVCEGWLTTGRIQQESPLNTRLRSLVSPQVKEMAWEAGPPVKLSIGTSGFLDTLEFVPDDTYQKDQLGCFELEIEPRAWGLNFRDVFVALGRLPGTELGYDCAGVVTRIGSSCDPAVVKPGDRVCGGARSSLRTHIRGPAMSFVKIPDCLSFEEAASFITPGITAYHSLIDVARLGKGEKVLIHSASGATGQMAVWIARMVEAEIFVTVGFEEKREFVINNLGIPADHVFYSRDTSFARGVMRVTKGYGVDVVLNSLSGDGLRASWECMAPYGRFVEIGKADIEANSALPMSTFARNVSFAAVDLHHVSGTKPERVRRLLEDVLELIRAGRIRHPSPLQPFGLSNVEQAFRSLQSGRNMGRIIITASPSEVVPKRLLEQSTWRLDPQASYVIVGASGGLGRAISMWMADRGARHLILLSRSGATSEASAKVVADLRNRGVNVAAPKCDVSSESSLAHVLRENASMPAIKGCINSSMALQDTIFDNMTYDKWELTLNSKVKTSWNLHKLLPESLDFFVLLSSLSGIYGSISQSNYSAGCVYQDALARYRVSQGQKAVSFDLGWMSNIGIVAETAAYQQNRESAADMKPITDKELMALLDIFCDPDLRSSELPSQLLVGAVTPADCLSRGVAPPPTALRPMFAGFSLADGGHQRGEAPDGMPNFALLFRQASGPDQSAEIVLQGLATKLARAMSIGVEDIEPSKQLSDYGVDSLMAVELRNWIARDFGANVAVYDIMGGTTIADIGPFVVGKSEVLGEK